MQADMLDPGRPTQSDNFKILDLRQLRPGRQQLNKLNWRQISLIKTFLTHASLVFGQLLMKASILLDNWIYDYPRTTSSGRKVKE